ncbi:MAG TPA: dihydrolipoamide acetyltransferase family protein [Actinomycetota bacterium]|jgi:2-oxoglutarate dehydrogenase E2 component (dihydrolipoamide succinyltransferase)
MATEVKMPQLGETVVEGTITKWLKSEGDTIEEDELLVEISTDKVDSEVPSSAAGTIQKILVQEGETVSVGTPLALIGEGSADASSGSGDESEPAEAKAEEADESGADAKQPAAQAGDAGDAAEAQAQERQAEGEAGDQGAEDTAASGKEEEESAPAASVGREVKREDDEDSKKAAAEQAAAADGRGDTSKRGIISPLVRRLADENDVSLDDIEGTGTGGRIRKQDVLKFVETRKAKPQARPAASAEEAPERAPEREPERAPAEERPASGGEREELVPWTNIRRRTAEHMVASHLETARAWNAVEADWTDVVGLRGRAKESFKKKEGFSLTYMPFLAKAVCETLLEMPEVNSSFDEENQANRVKRYVNLGIAVALEGGGLIVPVVKAADEKNIVGLARAINDVATRARSKKLSPDDLVGGTFTITNPGPFGSIMSVPIIPKGQAAILAFEAIEKRVVVTDDDALAIRSMGFLPMSWDHRVIDGAEAAKFLAALRKRIETTDFSSELAPYL